jgi:hypothetical protein
MFQHVANENKSDDQADKCISFARLECAIDAWDILCERLDGLSFVRFMSLLYNLMLRQRPDQSLTKYVALHATNLRRLQRDL